MLRLHNSLLQSAAMSTRNTATDLEAHTRSVEFKPSNLRSWPPSGCGSSRSTSKPGNGTRITGIFRHTFGATTSTIVLFEISSMFLNIRKVESSPTWSLWNAWEKSMLSYLHDSTNPWMYLRCMRSLNICRCNSTYFNCSYPTWFMEHCGYNSHVRGVIFGFAGIIYLEYSAKNMVYGIGTGSGAPQAEVWSGWAVRTICYSMMLFLNSRRHRSFLWTGMTPINCWDSLTGLASIWSHGGYMGHGWVTTNHTWVHLDLSWSLQLWNQCSSCICCSLLQTVAIFCRRSRDHL